MDEPGFGDFHELFAGAPETVTGGAKGRNAMHVTDFCDDIVQ